MPTNQQHPSSFRDPSGFVFEAEGRLLRQINSSYAEEYELLLQSGLYKKLTNEGRLISHEETDFHGSTGEAQYKTIIPQFIPINSFSVFLASKAMSIFEVGIEKMSAIANPVSTSMDAEEDNPAPIGRLP